VPAKYQTYTEPRKEKIRSKNFREQKNKKINKNFGETRSGMQKVNRHIFDRALFLFSNSVRMRSKLFCK